jgi:PHD/YefM family antitoxin component YafN of YafNO toxin-antitoxin module
MAIITASEFVKDPGPSIKLAEETGEPTVIMSGGKPVAAVLHPEALRSDSDLAKLSPDELALLESVRETT